MPNKLTPAQFHEASTLLVEVLRFAAPADALLSAHFRKNPRLGSHDRARIADCVYGVLRHLLALRWLMPEATPRMLLLLWLARFQGISLRELAPFTRERNASGLPRPRPPRWKTRRFRSGPGCPSG